MCLIAATNVGKHQIPLEYLENAYEHNSDGWGVMFPKGDKTLEIRNSLSDFKEFQRYWEKVVPNDRPIAVHFRFTTRGMKTVDNTHPFKIFDWKTHKYELAMMHNGTISINSEEKETTSWSDTKLFAHKIIKPLFKHAPGIIRKDVSRKVLSEYIGSGNKLVFMDGNGVLTFVNEEEGMWEKGVWYSNSYSLAKPYYRRSSSFGFSGYKSMYGYDDSALFAEDSAYDKWLKGEREKSEDNFTDSSYVIETSKHQGITNTKVIRDVEPEEQLEFDATLTEQAIEQILVNGEGDMDDDVLDSIEEFVRDNPKEVARYLFFKVGME